MREEDIPIDINYNKLLDWLIDRRHCNLKWQQHVAPIKEKIHKAAVTLKDEEKVLKILEEPNVNYFHCKEVKKCLEESGQGTKTIFGQYSSQIMKGWNELLQQYETENVYLAEAAAELMRNVNYEIPSLKKKIGKAQQTQRDCTRKEAEYMANGAAFKEKYLQSCREMDVKGEDIQKELLSQVTQLPTLHNEVAEKVKELQDAITYYSTFTKFVVSSNSDEKEPSGDKVIVLPLLNFLIDHGNATVHQWRTGEEPETEEQDKDDQANQEGNAEEEAGNNGIDWGDLDSSESAGTPATGIDFSVIDVLPSNSDAIDFGDASAIDGIDFGDSQGSQIDWSSVIEVVDTSGNEAKLGANGTEAATEVVSGTKGQTNAEDKLTILEFATTRNQFLDELIELQAFLNQRSIEMGLEADVISVNQFQSAPVLIQLQTKEQVLQMKKRVTQILDNMNSTKMKNLYLLKSSERFVHRIADALHQKLKISENTIAQARIVADRRKEALQIQRDSEPQLQALIQKTKVLQKQIAAEISKKYKNRVVNIMGDINTI